MEKPAIFVMVAKIEKIEFIIAISCFLIGLYIYLSCRPTTLLIFNWLDTLGLSKYIAIIHNKFNLPYFIKFSIPFALWVLGYLFLIKVIWRNSTSLVQYIWFGCVPIIAIIAELAQYFHIISGTFDTVDLICIIGTVIFFMIYKLRIKI